MIAYADSPSFDEAFESHIPAGFVLIKRAVHS
jgi:hypothetical protein